MTEWELPTSGTTISIVRGATSNIRFYAGDGLKTGAYYLYKFVISSSDSGVAFSNGTQNYETQAFQNKEEFDFNVQVRGVTGGRTATISIICCGSQSGQGNDYTSIETRTVTVNVISQSTTYDLTVSVPAAGSLVAEDVLNCPYAGRIIAVELPKGVFKLECWGGKGGDAKNAGGKGGYSCGVFTTEHTIVYLVTGGAGADAGGSTNAGGYNGGGNGIGTSGKQYSSVGGGGGCSHISLVTGLLSSLSANQSSVLLVAGGGGGAGAASSYYSDGGVGGGLTGGTASAVKVVAATGGTQSGGGSGETGAGGSGFGQGAYSYNGGGGGGWYGGGPGYYESSSRRSGGGGGSSYYNTTALTEYSTTAGNASMPAPAGGTETGHSGNGYIRITVIANNEKTPFKAMINNQFKTLFGYRVNVGGTWKSIDAVYSKINGQWKEME